MITVPLYTTLFLYMLFLAIFAIFVIINFYHIIISGSFTLTAFTISFFTFVLTVLTLYFTVRLLQGVDWQQPLTLFNIEWFGILKI